MSNRLSDYDYELPEELIAQDPLEDRAASRLLWLHNNPDSNMNDGSAPSFAHGQVTHHKFREITGGNLLRAGDLLIMNNTRVTALRIMGKKDTGAKVEALLLQEGTNPGEYVALTFPARKLKPGTTISFEGDLTAVVAQDIEGSQGQKVLQFLPKGDPSLVSKLQAVGKTPLPPYIKAELHNPERYQTVYAVLGGSAAAPTAGLHFTTEILDQLKSMGVIIAYVTLHVSMDTFRPIHEEDLTKIVMHGERCSIPPETVAAVHACTGRIIAVGTTTVRTLETFAVGKRRLNPDMTECLSKLFIRPGGDVQFQIVDGMFTNFHMPKTTMLMMISQLAGWDEVKHAYVQAVAEKYRFLSFGDSMLIL